MSLTIGELARSTGETVKTLRFWADRNLLEIERAENRYRYFPDGMIRRVATIRQIQELGFSLSEIRDMIALRERGLEPCRDVRERLQQHLHGVREKRTHLERLEAELRQRLTWASNHPNDTCEDSDSVCVILDRQHAPSARPTATH